MTSVDFGIATIVVAAASFELGRKRFRWAAGWLIFGAGYAAVRLLF